VVVAALGAALSLSACCTTERCWELSMDNSKEVPEKKMAAPVVTRVKKLLAPRPPKI
jgi:hypothetical protein